MFFFLALIVALCTSTQGKIDVQVIDGEIDVPLPVTVNSSIEYIIVYNAKTKAPLRVNVASDDGSGEAPLMIVVRQRREVLSWELPMTIEDNNGGLRFNQSARTLCYDSTGNNRTLADAIPEMLMEGSNLFLLEDSPIISISTSSVHNVHANVLVQEEKNFYIEPNEEYTINVTPSETRFFYYDFPDNVSTEDNMRTVVLEVNSNDDICMTISIQNASCPVYDLNNNIKFEGYWETINRKGGVTISGSNHFGILVYTNFMKILAMFVAILWNLSNVESGVHDFDKSKFPNGFFVVFVAKADDLDCTGDETTHLPSHNKTITYIIKPSIGHAEYLFAVLTTIICVALFYLVFGVSFFMCSRRVYVPRTMEYMSAANTPTTTIATEPDLDNISYDETEYDTIAEVVLDRATILNKPDVFLSDLARKDFRILKKKSYSYLWHVLTVALFYGLPVIQLVITYQKVLNDTGNQDLCYYNFLCAHPYGFFSDFNHLFSNIGYVFLGFLFIWNVYRREQWHKDNDFDQRYGIPQHYGLFYAMGVALSMEGVLSGSYHICPNHSNFQFDTSFMYIMAVLCMVKIYQTRHPDINATAYSTFGVLAVAILLGMLGILEASIYFWISFTILHVFTGFYLTAHIYYMGCWKLDRGLARRVFRICVYDFWARPLHVIKPMYTSRFVLLLIGNICNWLLAVFGLYNHDRDFAMYLLAIFMMNTMLYFIFYITMKLLHRERINCLALLFLVISLTCAACAMYCFLNKSISWALTPAESRRFNQECKLMHFYDYHDIWHFLSAVGMFFMFMMLLLLDDDLSHVHRSKIHVF